MKAGADNPLVAHLVAAHHTGHLVPYADALVPHDIVAAYATQSHVAEALARGCERLESRAFAPTARR